MFRANLRFNTLLIIGIFCVSFGWANAQSFLPKSNSEERLVKRVYEKLSFYQIAQKRADIYDEKYRAKEADDIDYSEKQIIDQNALKFTIDNVQTGSIDEILNRKVTDLVTPPDDRILKFVRVETNNGKLKFGKKIIEEGFGVQARWKEGIYSGGSDSDWTFRETFNYLPARFSNVTEYITYQVTVTFDQYTRTYNAIALLRGNYRSSKASNPIFIDNVTSFSGILNEIYEKNTLPVGTKKKPKKDKDKKDKKESSLQSRDSGNKVNFVKTSARSLTGKKQFHPCDFSLYCECVDWTLNPFSELGENDVCWEVFDPYPEPNPIGGGGGGSYCPAVETPTVHDGQESPNSKGHYSGRHLLETGINTVCKSFSNCTQQCNVSFRYNQATESGYLAHFSTTYHNLVEKVEKKNDQGSYNSPVSCSAMHGVGVQSCYRLIGCSGEVSVTGSGVDAKVTGGDVWNAEHVQGRTCEQGK